MRLMSSVSLKACLISVVKMDCEERPIGLYNREKNTDMSIFVSVQNWIHIWIPNQSRGLLGRTGTHGPNR